MLWELRDLTIFRRVILKPAQRGKMLVMWLKSVTIMCNMREFKLDNNQTSQRCLINS